MICQKCKKEFEEKDIQEHHLHPKFMDNPSGLGKKVYLCEKCHNILHLLIPSIIFKSVYDKSLVTKEVINFTMRWVSDNV